MIVDDLDWYSSRFFSALQVTPFGWTTFIEIYVWLDCNTDVDQEDP